MRLQIAQWKESAGIGGDWKESTGMGDAGKETAGMGGAAVGSWIACVARLTADTWRVLVMCFSISSVNDPLQKPQYPVGEIWEVLVIAVKRTRTRTVTGFGAGGVCGLDSSSAASTAQRFLCFLPARWEVMLPTGMSVSHDSQRYAWLTFVGSAFIFGFGIAVSGGKKRLWRCVLW